MKNILFTLSLFLSLSSVSHAGCDTTALQKIAADSGQSIAREKNLERLQNEEFDLIVVGGGAVGTGTALDAANRGLKVALIERDDFAAGTSSRSTKLAHGGVRYVEQAVLGRDFSKFKLIYEGLEERSHFLRNAPHLSEPLQFVTPLYRAWEVPFTWAGLKTYDALASLGNTSGGNTGVLARLTNGARYFLGMGPLPPSRLLSPKQAKILFPELNPKGLKGAILYSDGKFDDARMAVSLALTAQEKGAAVANHLGVNDLIKMDGKVSGVRATDTLTGKSYSVRGKVVVNATGPFGDTLRKMDDPNAQEIIRGSSGTHVVLNDSYPAPKQAVLIPKTPDGRVVFIVPFKGKMMLGTTDNPTSIVANPKTTEDDIRYILETAAPYFVNPPAREHVASSWTGIRPLVTDPNVANTAALSRDYSITETPSGMINSLGGKWTGYRPQSQHTVDRAITVAGLNPPKKSPSTLHVPIAGAKGYSSHLAKDLQRDHGIPTDLAEHLARTYGDRAHTVANIMEQGYETRLAEKHPYTEADIAYVTLYESARNPVDALARRLRLSFIDQKAAIAAIPKTVEIMGDILQWDKERRETESQKAVEYFEGR